MGDNPKQDRVVTGLVGTVDDARFAITGIVTDDGLWKAINQDGPLGYSIGGTIQKRRPSWWASFRLWLGGLVIAIGQKIQGRQWPKIG